MSLLLLIDGYNVLAPTAPPRVSDPMWLHRERMQLIERLATHLPKAICVRTHLVFDAANPPPDRPDRFSHQGIGVQFAIAYPEADDLLEEIIRGHSSPKQLTVISSDHRVQAAAARRGATAFDSQDWFDDLLDGKLRLSPRAKVSGQGRGALRDGASSNLGARDEDEPSLAEEDVSDWMDKFGF